MDNRPSLGVTTPLFRETGGARRFSLRQSTSAAALFSLFHEQGTSRRDGILHLLYLLVRAVRRIQLTVRRLSPPYPLREGKLERSARSATSRTFTAAVPPPPFPKGKVSDGPCMVSIVGHFAFVPDPWRRESSRRSASIMAESSDTAGAGFPRGFIGLVEPVINNY